MVDLQLRAVRRPAEFRFGPTLFLLYMADLLIEKHDLHPHLYTDDTRSTVSADPVTSPSSRVGFRCV